MPDLGATDPDLEMEIIRIPTRTDGAQLAWTLDGLEQALDVYCAEVEAADLAPDTKRTYIRHSTTFVRWLAGDFTPGAGH